MTKRKRPSAPLFHIAGARKGRQAKATIPRATRTPADLARENRTRAFRCGLALGFGVAALVFALVLLLWLIPAVDGAVETARAMANGAVPA